MTYGSTTSRTVEEETLRGCSADDASSMSTASGTELMEGGVSVRDYNLQNALPAVVSATVGPCFPTW